jgi:hypothetical protein
MTGDKKAAELLCVEQIQTLTAFVMSQTKSQNLLHSVIGIEIYREW